MRIAVKIMIKFFTSILVIVCIIKLQKRDTSGGELDIKPEQMSSGTGIVLHSGTYVR